MASTAKSTGSAERKAEPPKERPARAATQPERSFTSGKRAASSSVVLERGAAERALNAVVDAARKGEAGQGGDAALAAARALLETITSQLVTQSPAVWTMETIAQWLDLPVTTVKIYVITHPEFPPGFRPTGKKGGMKRWFADDVIEFARKIERRT